MSSADSQTPFQLFLVGVRAGFSLPPFMVFVAMIGFGSLAKSQGIDLFATLLTAAGIYGLPGQVAMVELYATGATLLAILIGVSMANMRFLPMSIVLIPQFDSSGPMFRWRYLIVQLMSINSWSYFNQVVSDIKPDARLAFFTGFGWMCFSLGLAGAGVGWVLAAKMPLDVTITLIFLNPAYFIFLFSTNRNLNIILSIIFGCLLGPLFYRFSPDWGLPLCGLVAGTLGYWLSGRLVRNESSS